MAVPKGMRVLMHLARHCDFWQSDKGLLVVLLLRLRFLMKKTIHLIETVFVINEVVDGTAICSLFVLLFNHFYFSGLLIDGGTILKVIARLGTRCAV